MNAIIRAVFCDKCPNFALAWLGDEILCTECLIESLKSREDDPYLPIYPLILASCDSEHHAISPKRHSDAA